MSDMQTPNRLPGSPMENKILSPPAPPSQISNVDFLYQSSRKRTFTTMNQHGELCIIGNQRSLQYGAQVGGGSVNIVLEDNGRGRDQGDGSIQLLKKLDGSDAGSLKHCLTATASPRNHESSVNIDGENGRMNSQCHDSRQSDEKVRPVAGKVGLAVTEKIWNGSLQLNSSVTISAVAFFKSGEKIPDTKWSESVEVKGKVRLEAFEKYIQDLPRSRNRGLMVISLRLKDGSSEAELARVKEIAKGYREGKKVGFAQLSPGNDLYICPRSDAVITILAKHGFFKGKAAIEKDHDSLIGCVVWRRKQALSNSVMKKSEKYCSSSEQPPSSPSDSSIQGVPDKKVSHAEPASKSTVASTTDSTTFVNSIETITTCSKAQPDVCSSSTIDSLLVPSVPCSSSLSVGLQASPFVHSTSAQGPMGQSLKADSSLVHYSGQEKRKPGLEVEKHVLRPPSAVVKGHISIYDDDDLPEYDFEILSGISQIRMSNVKLSAGGSGIRDGLPLTMPTFNHRRSENVNLPLPSHAIEKILPVKRVSDRDQIPVLPLPEEKHIVQSRAPLALTDAISVPRRKNLFDDDDDMPEWCPPDVNLHKQEKTGASTVCVPSIAPNLPMECLYPPHLPYPPPPPFYNNPRSQPNHALVQQSL